MMGFKEGRERGMLQSAGTLGVFKNFLDEEKFDRIVEIGTGNGNFTIALSSMYDGMIHTFDRESNKLNRKGGQDRIRAYRVHVFEEPSFIIELIVAPGRVLLLCDGGIKSREVNIFGKHLKPDDVVMAHDYGSEITEEDVRVSNLEPYFQDQFASVHWMSKRRK